MKEPANLSRSSVNFAFGEVIWPIEASDFFSRFWERKPLVIHRLSPEYYLDLLSPQDLDHIIASRQLRYPECKLVKNGKEIPMRQYVRPASASNGTIDTDALYSEYDKGATIILNSVHRYWRPLSLLCNYLEKCFNHPLQTNIYLTPRKSQGFAAHYDTHDVFILQITGSKRWQIYDSPIRLPNENQPYDSSTMRRGRLRLACRLEAGDMLYIPRGRIHKATAQKNSTLHVTLGLTPYTWGDAFWESLATVCREHSSFREALPPGFGKRKETSRVMKRKFAKLMKEFSKHAKLVSSVEKITERFLHTRPRLLDGQLLELRRLHALDGQSVMCKRATIIYRIRKEGEKICLAYYGKEIRFPAFVGSALRFVTKNDQFKIASIPGLDERSKLVLVRRLVREGFLTLAMHR
jgi:ribosomal protein L16 Arg81 hydroxylase